VHILQWFSAAFGGDEVRDGASREALGALFEAGGGSLMAVATVLYIGAVVSGHFKNGTSIEYKSTKTHFELFWFIASRLVWCVEKSIIVIPSVEEGDAWDALKENIDKILLGAATASRMGLEDHYSSVMDVEGGGDEEDEEENDEEDEEDKGIFA